MHDEWSKKLSGGRIAEYTSDITPEAGGVITKKMGNITTTAAVKEQMTRAQVEAALDDESPNYSIRILIYAFIFVIFLILIVSGYMRFFYRQFPR